jgi:hypothetical protein
MPDFKGGTLNFSGGFSFFTKKVPLYDLYQILVGGSQCLL